MSVNKKKQAIIVYENIVREYDNTLLLQAELEKSGRFSFISVPTFASAGSSYVVHAEVTSPDFELKEAK